MAENKLYFGDNLDILRRYVKDESVDLVYLDPPFKSNQDYNILFQEQNGSRSEAQIKAFEDTWRWDRGAAEAYQEIVEAGGKVSQAMQAFRMLFGENDMLAYLAMMAPRLVELHRVLKPTGSIYLHCDPTASHYLKVLMDAVFGPENSRSEIIWKRTYAHGSSRRYAPVHDTILFYSKTQRYVWTGLSLPHDPEYVGKHFTYRDAESGRLFQPISLTGAGLRRGESGKPWKGIDPSKVGRHWALPRGIVDKLAIRPGSVQEKLDMLDAAGLIHWPEKLGGTPRLKWYADELGGVALSDDWGDIKPISARAKERLGYPTQKPEALLERIIKAGSDERDMVLDPFCGCGTTIAVAQRLKRRWIGIDITHLAVSLIKHRLRDSFGDKIVDEDGRTRPAVEYDVIGEPVSLPDAEVLAKQDPYQFQWWALGLVGARPVQQKKGADKGIDGRLYFHDEREGKTKQIVLQVKAGHLTVAHLRDLRGVMEREKAQIAVLVTLQNPTESMRAEAAAAGFYDSPGWGKRYPRLQILTVAELLQGKGIDYPPAKQVNVTFNRAPEAKRNGPEQTSLPGFP